MLSGKKVLIFDLGGVVIDLFVDRTFAALVSLASIAIYYALLAALHKRISKKIVFTINKI